MYSCLSIAELSSKTQIFFLVESVLIKNKTKYKLCMFILQCHWEKSGRIIMICGFLLLFSSVQNVFQLQKKFYLPHEMWSRRGWDHNKREGQSSKAFGWWICHCALHWLHQGNIITTPWLPRMPQSKLLKKPSLVASQQFAFLNQPIKL